MMPTPEYLVRNVFLIALLTAVIGVPQNADGIGPIQSRTASEKVSPDQKSLITRILTQIASPQAERIRYVFQEESDHQIFRLSTSHTQRMGIIPDQSQIVVKMKLVNDPSSTSKVRTIGTIAPQSWVDFKGGTVQLATDIPRSQCRFWIGVMCVDPENDAQRPDQHGLKVKEVVPGSAADEAGVQKQDWLISMNDVVLDSTETLIKHIQINGGTQTKLKVRRGDDHLTLEIVPRLLRQKTYQTRTLLAPANRFKEANEKILELEKSLEDLTQSNQRFRLVIVGSGINFGTTDVNLELKEEKKEGKSGLAELLGGVAENRFAVSIVNDVLKVYEANDVNSADRMNRPLQQLHFHPHQLWSEFSLSSNGQSIDIQKLIPKILTKESQVQSPDQTGHTLSFTAPFIINRDDEHNYRHRIGCLVLPTPFLHGDLILKDTIDRLSVQKQEILKQNQSLKNEIGQLKKQLRVLKATIKKK